MYDYGNGLKQKLQAVITPRVVHARFPLVKTECGIEVGSTVLTLTGSDIRRLLEYSDECILMAATLGIETDRLIDYAQKTSIAEAAALDALASEAIEDVCDALQTELGQMYGLTRRYSCGYGDLPLDIQPVMLSVLNAQRAIGLFCGESNIMTPRKSVTAIWGITNSERDIDCCESCRLRQECDIRRAGGECGHKRICEK